MSDKAAASDNDSVNGERGDVIDEDLPDNIDLFSTVQDDKNVKIGRMMLDRDGAETVRTVVRRDDKLTDWDAADDAVSVLDMWPPDRLEALKNALKAAPWHDTTYKLQTVPNAMSGEEVSDWLRNSNFAKDAETAIQIGDAMVLKAMIFQLNKKDKRQGFVPDQHFKYTLESVNIDGNVFKRAVSKALLERSKRSKYIAGAQQGVRYETFDNVVIAYVEQRWRRPNKDEPFDADNLIPSKDPEEFSMKMDDVPVPAVGDASPDECEWVMAWEPETSEETDQAGWQYGYDFTEKGIWNKDVESGHLLRRRVWKRPARKIPEKKEIEMPDKLTGEAAGEHKTDEELQKEMMEKAAHVRVPRAGFLEVHIQFGRDLIRICDSIVVLNYKEHNEKSEVCKKAQQHQWDYKTTITIDDDMEPVDFSIWQIGTLGKRSFLGRSEIFIPEHATNGDRTAALVPRDDEDDAEVKLMAETLGSVALSWTFTVDESSTADATGPIAIAKRDESGGRRCILDWNVLRGENITVAKRRGGPCGTFSFGKKKHKIFVRAHYRGEYCDMMSQSPPSVLGKDGSIDFNWHAIMPLIPTVPVKLEVLTHPDESLIGFINFEEPHERQVGVTTAEFTLEKPKVEGIASAEVALGKLKINWTWLLEADPTSALKEAATIQRHRYVEEMKKAADAGEEISEEDRLKLLKIKGGETSEVALVEDENGNLKEAETRPRGVSQMTAFDPTNVPVFVPKQQKDLLSVW